jgi:hypothetical protein
MMNVDSYHSSSADDFITAVATLGLKVAVEYHCEYGLRICLVVRYPIFPFDEPLWKTGL